MWYLEWTSGKSGHDSDEHTHTKNLSDTLGINDQLEARELAIIAWEDVRKQPQSYAELYCNPQLVWKEPLIQ
jgi:hypothetical protein